MFCRAGWDPNRDSERYMRYPKALMALIIVTACGGGSDITSPSGSFTLSVAGDGTGAGQVTTNPGVEPAIDCTLAADAQPSGTHRHSGELGLDRMVR